MKKVLLTLIFMLSFSSLIMSQTHKCGTDEVMEEAFKNDPTLRQRLEQNEKELQEKLKQRKNSKVSTTYEKQIIPVVIHIIHTYGSENVSEAQCLDAIRILNEDFQRRGADSSLIASAFMSIRGNANLEFRLAKIDPNGKCTNGITRTYSTLTNNAGDNVKDIIYWDTQKYFNIWVADNVFSGSGNQVGGFAYYPCSAPGANKEGVIVTHRQFGSIGTSGGNFSARTLPHEVGHALNLAHTWGSTNEPGLATNCDVDDGVADTPNTIGSSGCNLSQVTCGTLDNVNNIMDYSNCARMFTEGQCDRVRIAADTNSSCNYRKYLSRYSNLIATGTNDGYVAACAPKADFDVIARKVCQGTSITFTDMSYQATVQNRLWKFEGGSPAISTDPSVAVTYNSVGTYKVTLIVSNANGQDSLVRNAVVTIVPAPGTIQSPYAEGMEVATWPTNNASDPLQNWTEEFVTSTNWERTTTAAATGTASARIRVSQIQTGRANSFISPVFDLSNITSSTHRFGFKVAYARRTTSGTGSADQLKVYVSSDCGNTWQARYNKSGSGLSTIGTGTSVANFIPTSTQWRTETISLSGIAGKPSIMFKFECTSNQGTIMYVDDINIYSIVGMSNDYLAESLNFDIYPNPSEGDAVMTFDLPEKTTYSIFVTDVLGKTIGNTINETKEAGSYQYNFSELNKNSANGIYFINFTTEKGTFRKKFIKN